MHKSVRNCVAEFKHNLGAVLRDLKLYVRVVAIQDYHVITLRGRMVAGQFYRPFSPVSIYLPKSAKAGPKDIGWAEATVTVDHWYAKPLADTGWVNWRQWDQSVFSIEEGGADIFSWLETQIRDYGVVNLPRGEQNIVDSNKLADAFWELEEVIRDLAVVKFPSDHDTDPQVSVYEMKEFLTFLNPNGQRVHMRFSEGASDEDIFIDGKSQGSFSTHNMDKVVLAAEFLSTGRSNVDWFLKQSSTTSFP